MKPVRFFVFTAFAVVVPVAADAQLQGASGQSVVFHAVASGGMKIDGKTSELTVNDDGSSVTVTVQLGNISTGIGLRDNHTRKYLEVGQYPTAELKVARSALKFPAGAETSGEARGTMKIHGQSREVPFRYTARKEGADLKVDGTAHVKITEFGIAVPSYLGVTVKPDVEIAVSFTTKDK